MIKTSEEMRKLIFLLITLVAVTTQAWADGKVVFTASAPDAVVVVIVYSKYDKSKGFSCAFYKRI